MTARDIHIRVTDDNSFVVDVTYSCPDISEESEKEMYREPKRFTLVAKTVSELHTLIDKSLKEMGVNVNVEVFEDAFTEAIKKDEKKEKNQVKKEAIVLAFG
jgi:hypothetical protein